MKNETPSALIESTESGFRGMVSRFREHSRQRRRAMFLQYFKIDHTTRLLDLGGWDGSHINFLLQGSGVKPANVFIADISAAAVASGAARFGFTPILLQEGQALPFEDKQFDVVFCSSVLEHVTLPKAEIWRETSGVRFSALARAAQGRFAAELIRVSKGYFVQVPYRWFPIETHTWLPLFSYLPRSIQIPLMRISNRWWIKMSEPDFYLPSIQDMGGYFPGCALLHEETFGLVKSLIAVHVDHVELDLQPQK